MDKKAKAPAHTPLPWRLINHNEICADDGHETFIAEVFDENEPEWRGNARLIATAPELLRSLELLDACVRMGSMKDSYPGSLTEQTVSHSIRKAYGKTS